MEIIIQYLIDKGGIFGALFAISLSWIVFRERSLLKNSSSDEQPKEESSAPKLPCADSASVQAISTAINDVKSSIGEIKTIAGEIKSSVSEVKAGSKKISAELTRIEGIVEGIEISEKSELVTINSVDNHMSALNGRVSTIERNIHDLWEWHSVKDNDGIPIWYVRRSFEETIVKLKQSIDNLEKTFSETNKSIYQDIDDRLQKVNDERVAELKKLLENYSKTVTDLIVALEKIKFLLNSKESGE